VADRPNKRPRKCWAQLFQKRHAAKAANWFDVTGKVLQDPAVLLQENVYNVGQTGVMLSNLNWVKVLVRTGDYPGDSGARVKRTTIAAVECVSASGKVLDPMIIWLASTHRANWTTQPTLGWQYVCIFRQLIH